MAIRDAIARGSALLLWHRSISFQAARRRVILTSFPGPRNVRHALVQATYRKRTGVSNMRSVAAVLVVFTAVFVALSVKGDTVSSLPGATQIISGPTLVAGRLKANKLICTGRDFAEGARIRISNEAIDREVVTRNDPETPTTRVVAKKGGKTIPLDTRVSICVANPDGGLSSLQYFRGRSLFSLVLPSDGAVTLQVGDYFFVSNLERATSWRTDPDILVRVFDVQLPSDAYASFRAVQPGVARFYLEIYGGGEAPPAVLYNTGIVVE